MALYEIPAKTRTDGDFVEMVHLTRGCPCLVFFGCKKIGYRDLRQASTSDKLC